MKIWTLLFCLIFPFKSEAFPIQNFIYLLQAEQAQKNKTILIEKLKTSSADWIILDAFFNDQRWTEQDLIKIRSGKKHRKILAYLSIGEAENYRVYWKKFWNKKKPDFILSENPQWPGNFLVKYWHPEWQKIIMQEEQMIIRQGFDGCYLDIVDAFERFEQHHGKIEDFRVNPETQNTYRQDMISWVYQIVKLAKKTRTDFLIIPQNGSQLLSDSQYRHFIDGIGIEDLYSLNNQSQNIQHYEYILSFLENLSPDKVVLIIEYASDPNLQKKIMTQIHKKNWPILFTHRALNQL